MNVTESTIQVERRVKRVNLEARLTLIRAVCQVFRRGCEEDAFTLKELKGACGFLSPLISAFDRDAGDLCLLASHAENERQFKPICHQGRRQWDPAMP